MKVVLTNPPQLPKNGYRAFYPSLGLLYLASFAEKNSQVKNLEITYLEGSAYNLNEFINKLSKMSPDVIGFTFTTPISMHAYAAIHRAKSEFPDTLIVCGGPHTTAMPFDVLRRSKADVCVIGEGEVTFTKLLDAYANKIDFSQVEGIVFRRNGKFLSTPPRGLINDLNSIPFPAWEKIQLKSYPGYILKKAWPDICITSTRGCPYNCVFCSNPVWKHSKPWIRMRSPENVAKEVEFLSSIGVREIFDYADEFNANIDWAIKVANRISKLNTDMVFKLQLRADKISESFARAISKMGCWLAHVGIESGNQIVLDGIKKNISLRQVVKGLRLLKKYDIKTQGFFMIFNVWEKNGRILFETPEMCENTLRFVRQLISERLIDNISWSITTPLPGSELFNICSRHRLFKEGITFSDLDTEKAIIKLPEIRERDISKIKFKGMLIQLYCSLLHGNVNFKNSLILAQKLKTLVKYGLESLFW